MLQLCMIHKPHARAINSCNKSLREYPPALNLFRPITLLWCTIPHVPSFPFLIKIYHWATRNISTSSHVTWPTVQKLSNVVCGEHLNEGPLGCIIWWWLLMNLVALIGPFFGHNFLFIIPYCLDWAIAPFPFWVCWAANLHIMHTHLPYSFWFKSWRQNVGNISRFHKVWIYKSRFIISQT
jgi:hypothetical protein